mgnify:FL=1
MSALHIEAPVEKNSKGSPLFLYLIVLSLIVLGVVSVRFFFGVGAPSPALPMEIANFAGKPQFYSAAEKRWRLVSRSDVFRSGDQLITAGGEEVDLKVTDLLFIRLKENSLVMNGGSGYVSRQNKLPLYRLNLEQGVILGTTVKDFKRKAQLLIGTPDAVLTAFT